MTQRLQRVWEGIAAAAAAVIIAVALSLAPQASAEAAEPSASIQVYEWENNRGDSCWLSNLTAQDILAGASIEGLSYNSATNTLTLSNYNDPAAVIYILGLGDDLKIEVVGSNQIGCLVMYRYGAEITGSGTLVVGGNIGETIFNDDYYGFNNAYGIEVGSYGDWEEDPNTQLVIGSEVSLLVYGPLDGATYGTAHIVVETSNYTDAIVVGGTLSATTTYEVWNLDGWDAGVLQDTTGVIAISYDASAATDTSDTADLTVDSSSLPTTSGAVAFVQEPDAALIDVIFANGMGYLTTAESNVYVVSIGVECWELHFWAEGLPVATLGIVDAEGYPATIQNMYLLNVDGAVYLNVDSPSGAMYALTDTTSAELLKSVFGIDGIAINDVPITILTE